jgi:hypothetical protein
VALGVGFGHQRQMSPFSFLRQGKSKAMNALDACAREDGGLRCEFLRQSFVHAAARTGVLALGVLANDYPVDPVAAFQFRINSR